MNRAEARAVRQRSCECKIAYGTVGHARGAALAAREQRNQDVNVYRCHFSPDHWHIGHCPSMAGLRRIALAIRVLSGSLEPAR